MQTEYYHHIIKQLVSRQQPLSTQSWDLLKPLIQLRFLEKEESVVREGQYYDHEIFILEGIIRGYYTAYDGHEANVIFMCGPDVAAHWQSRTVEHKSIISYQAMKASVIAEIHNQPFQDLMLRYSDIRQFAMSVVFQGLTYKTMRERQLLTTNAESRYKAFLEMYPGLESEVPQYHIASYLGITPVQLSRIRASLVK